MQPIKLFIPEGLTCKSPYVYRIFHKPSNRYYVGSKYEISTCDSSTFMTETGYQTSSKQYVWPLIDADGLDSFRVDRIRHFATDVEAVTYEARLLKKVDAMHNDRFINRSNGGKTFRCLLGTNKGRKKSEETKRKMSEAAKCRKPVSDEIRKKLSIAAKNRKPMSEEHKRKIGIAVIGRRDSLETKEKKSKANKNRVPASNETREKIRIAATGQIQSKETREKHSISAKGRKWYNNGIICKMFKEYPGEDWIIGRLCPIKSQNMPSLDRV